MADGGVFTDEEHVLVVHHAEVVGVGDAVVVADVGSVLSAGKYLGTAGERIHAVDVVRSIHAHLVDAPACVPVGVGKRFWVC